MANMANILFVDAYDSFSQNVIALLNHELSANISEIKIDTDVEREFGASLESFVAQFDAVVLGPGPGNPNDFNDAGMLYDLFDAASINRVPILGICLGFQVLCAKYGLPITRMKEPCHGQPKQILYYPANGLMDNDRDIFEDVDRDNIEAICYNSLGLKLLDAMQSPNTSRPGSSGTNASFSTTSSQGLSTPNSKCRVLAVDSENNVMAIRHRELPFWGVQFHPESCKSSSTCVQLVRNWWKMIGPQRDAKNLTARNQCHVRQGVKVQTHEGTLPTFSGLGKMDLAETSSIVARCIASELIKTSASSCNKVQWKQTQATCTRQQISELVNDIPGAENIVMLESTKKGRFSIYAVLAQDLFQDCNDVFEKFESWQVHYLDSKFSIKGLGSESKFCISAEREQVWAALKLLMAEKRAGDGPIEVPFWGGFIGYLSYEHGLDQLGIKSCGSENRSIPDLSLMWVERSIIYDNQTSTAYVQSIRKHDDRFINTMTALLQSPASSWSRSALVQTARRKHLEKLLSVAQIALPNHKNYISEFNQCQSELRAGNSYELCLTTEATITVLKSTHTKNYEFELYKNLHAHNPVPFGAFLKLGNVTILGTSPEQYMSWSREGIIDMIPMKGTVKRSPDMTFERAAAILSTPKESAENLMIADLIRHDLYSSLGYRSKVAVMQLCEVIEHETVYQLVSHIRAHAPIPEDAPSDWKQQQAISYGLKTLQQTVPPGSMTGAPKKRSCEILSNLEQRNRGVYSGVLGYMDVGGGGNWNVCIRTAFHHDGEDKEGAQKGEDVWHLGAGGAITVLSDAEGEWQEMMVKLNSVLQGFKTVKA